MAYFVGFRLVFSLYSSDSWLVSSQTQLPSEITIRPMTVEIEFSRSSTSKDTDDVISYENSPLAGEVKLKPVSNQNILQNIRQISTKISITKVVIFRTDLTQIINVFFNWRSNSQRSMYRKISRLFLKALDYSGDVFSRKLNTEFS